MVGLVLFPRFPVPAFVPLVYRRMSLFRRFRVLAASRVDMFLPRTFLFLRRVPFSRPHGDDVFMPQRM